MQSKRKGNTVVTHAVADNVITFAVGPQSFDVDAALVAFGEANGERQAAWTDLHPNGRAGIIHGIVQKVSDRAAIGRDPETGASASPEEKFAAMKECADRLMSGGPWNAVATGTGTAGGLLYRAMRALYPNAWSDKTSFALYIAEKALSESERLKKKVTENDVRAGLGAVKKVAKEMERIRQEEGKSVGINANEFLQELETTK